MSLDPLGHRRTYIRSHTAHDHVAPRVTLSDAIKRSFFHFKTSSSTGALVLISRTIVFAGSLLLFIPFSHAQTAFLKGADLRNALRSLSETNIRSIAAIGYVSAIADDMWVRQAMTEKLLRNPPTSLARSDLVRIGNSTTSCMPSTVTREQLIAVVLKWLEENPATWSEPASTSVSTALISAFPCSYEY